VRPDDLRHAVEAGEQSAFVTIPPEQTRWRTAEALKSKCRATSASVIVRTMKVGQVHSTSTRSDAPFVGKRAVRHCIR
jgi:phosphoenolpyruvate-protein kinase (PTS system EI component)